VLIAEEANNLWQPYVIILINLR